MPAALERAVAPGAEEIALRLRSVGHAVRSAHRAEADWRAFEQLAARFEASFGLAAPDWLADEETAHLPPEMQHGGNAYFDLAGVLDGEAAAQLDSMRRRAAHHGALHLDLSKVADIEAEGCLRLSQTLRVLSTSATSVLVTGGDRLIGLLRNAAAGDGAEPGYWTLLIDLYQLEGSRRSSSARRSSTRCPPATPPDWEAAVKPVIAPRAIASSATSRATSRAPR